MKNIVRICVAHFIFVGALALGQTNTPFQHPKDQIALQLGAIQMGYAVPFQLVGNPTSAQQAANALAMGRNILSATASKPAVKVQGFVSSPAIDSVEFRDQLYQAVEAVVTSPVIGSIKGSVILETGKKQSVSAKLALPPSSYTIPVPYALESASSIDAQALTTQVNSLSGSVAAVQKQSSDLSTDLGSLSDEMSAVESLTTTLSSTVSTLGNQAGALTTQVESLAGDVTTTQSKTASISDNLSTLTNNLTELQSQNAALKQLLMGLDVFTSVTTLAGNGRDGYVDGMGSEAEFSYPNGVAVDGAGNIYAAEVNNYDNSYRIRKITPEGEVSTLFSFDGDVENGNFDYCAIAADVVGNVYVAENGHIRSVEEDYFIHKVRKITPEGDISTMMEEKYADEYPYYDYGYYNYFMDTKLGGIVVDVNGFVYVTQSIVEFDEYGDATWNGGIRKISPSGELSTIVNFMLVGTPPPQLTNIGNPKMAASSNEDKEMAVIGFPEAIGVDAQGNIYVFQSLTLSNEYYVDHRAHRVSKIAPDGIISILSEYTIKKEYWGDGPSKIAVGANGNVYVTDSAYHRVRRISSTGAITTMAGGGRNWEYDGGFADGPGTEALLSEPSGVAVDAGGNVYVADTGNNRIRKITVLK